MDYIDPKEYEKLNVRVGKIKGIKQHPTTKDYILLIDLGVAERDMQIVADLSEGYSMDELEGKYCVFIENIEPDDVGGVESQGMLLITHLEGKPVLISPEKEVLVGVHVVGVRDTERYHHVKE